ncbi:hypothetical protein PENTCL1PPCAC_27506 [Pristionchus entomophagus]|uniref:Uncharacterized protein n=1 Tax=Pristionchus entomophagus TaxID=358040 RepID=A0AAV5UEP0_9BILA|nr:hypothetical protein PENTCL1PPCAC_27506 [Pristionchus entomophagus]
MSRVRAGLLPRETLEIQDSRIGEVSPRLMQRRPRSPTTRDSTRTIRARSASSVAVSTTWPAGTRSIETRRIRRNEDIRLREVGREEDATHSPRNGPLSSNCFAVGSFFDKVTPSCSALHNNFTTLTEVTSGRQRVLPSPTTVDSSERLPRTRLTPTSATLSMAPSVSLAASSTTTLFKLTSSNGRSRIVSSRLRTVNRRWKSS